MAVDHPFLRITISQAYQRLVNARRWLQVTTSIKEMVKIRDEAEIVRKEGAFGKTRP